MEFNHVGLAVKNIKKYHSKILKPLFGFEYITDIEIVKSQNVRTAFTTNSSGARIELIEPIDDDSPVVEVLNRNTGGLYHLGFTTTSFEEDIEKLKKNKFFLISKKGGLAFLMAPTLDIYELVDKS